MFSPPVFHTPKPKTPQTNQLILPTIKSPNYTQIYKILYESKSPELILKTLQALRWRITKASDSTERIEVIRQYIEAKSPKAESFLLSTDALKFHKNQHEKIPEFYARFFNTVASIQLGRNYLSNSTKPALFFLEKLKESKDGLLRDNLLGTLQKLSLKRQVQTALIKNGCIGYLINLLDSVEEGIITKKSTNLEKSLRFGVEFLGAREWLFVHNESLFKPWAPPELKTFFSQICTIWATMR